MGLSFLLRQQGKEESWKEQGRSQEVRGMLGAGSAVQGPQRMAAVTFAQRK